MDLYRPIISNQSDLERAWRHLMGPTGYHRHSVWWMLIEPDGRPIPHLAELEDAADVPDDDERAAFASFLTHFTGGTRPPHRLPGVAPGPRPAKSLRPGLGGRAVRRGPSSRDALRGGAPGQRRRRRTPALGCPRRLLTG